LVLELVEGLTGFWNQDLWVVRRCKLVGDCLGRGIGRIMKFVGKMATGLFLII
jgi:hypothetical protein